MEKLLEFANQKRTAAFARYSLGVMLVWFGAMNFTTVGEGIVQGWLSNHMLFNGFTERASSIAMATGVAQILVGLMLFYGKGLFGRVGAVATAVLSFYSLTLLLLASVWIADLGGFPVIGAGQGIIKYVTIAGVAIYLSTRDAKARKLGLMFILFGLILVLGWIGGMKFTAIEAAGIKPLLETSPFFFWLLSAFGEQGASNFIGVVELITVGALLGWFFNRRLFLFGAAMCVVTFFGTLSFMITLPGWEDSLGGFPALSRSGHFLLKDLVLLAGVGLLIANCKPVKT